MKRRTPPRNLYLVLDQHYAIVDAYRRPPKWLAACEKCFKYDLRSTTPMRRPPTKAQPR